MVHKDIICARSKFFQAACSERWLSSKASEKKIKLPEVDPQSFQKYLGWVYSGELDLSNFEPTSISSSTFSDYGYGIVMSHDFHTVAKYIELYLLGDKLDDIDLRNKTMRTLVLDASTIPHWTTTHRVWSNTPETSSLRRMIVDREIARTGRKFLASNLTKYPTEFVEQVALSLLQDTRTKDKKDFNEKLPSYLEQVQEVESNSLD